MGHLSLVSTVKLKKQKNTSDRSIFVLEYKKFEFIFIKLLDKLNCDFNRGLAAKENI